MNMYQKREQRKNNKETDKSCTATSINWDSGAYRQLYSNHWKIYSIAKIFKFDIGKTLKETISELPEITVDDYVIIPL